MPFSIKLEKRLEPSKAISYLVPVASFVLALLFGAILLALAGADPWQTYRAMLEGAFGAPACDERRQRERFAPHSIPREKDSPSQ